MRVHRASTSALPANGAVTRVEAASVSSSSPAWTRCMPCHQRYLDVVLQQVFLVG